MKVLKSIAVVAVLLAVGQGAIAQQTPPGLPPGKTEYATWSKFKPGTVVKYQTDGNVGGQATKMTMTTTLKSVMPEKAVLETMMSVNMMGQEMKQPAVTREIKASEPTPKAPSEAEQAKMPKPTMGEDTVTVAGQTFKCQTAETEGEQNGMKIKAKVWSSDEVPGSLVKMVSHMSGPISGETTMTLVEFKPGS